MRTRRSASRTAVAAAVLSVACLVTVAACGNGSSDSSAQTKTDANGIVGGGAVGSGSAPEGTDVAGSRSYVAPGDAASPETPGGAKQAALLTEAALIKTGSVSLQSTDIGRVLNRVYALVGAVGGDISSEDTRTNDKGTETRSALVIRVPVGRFDAALNEIAGFAHLVGKARTSEDATTAVADINSRVHSAERSIASLRRLFSKATQLGDIIALESELSRREADLESLQAQQRSLADRTTFSTITVTIDLPPAGLTPAPKPTDDNAGFLAGIHQGWNAMTTTIVAVGHGLGVVLPLGTVLLLLAGIGFWSVRRWAPVHRSVPKES